MVEFPVEETFQWRHRGNHSLLPLRWALQFMYALQFYGLRLSPKFTVHSAENGLKKLRLLTVESNSHLRGQCVSPFQAMWRELCVVCTLRRKWLSILKTAVVQQHILQRLLLQVYSFQAGFQYRIIWGFESNRSSNSTCAPDKELLDKRTFSLWKCQSQKPDAFECTDFSKTGLKRCFSVIRDESQMREPGKNNSIIWKPSWSMGM